MSTVAMETSKGEGTRNMQDSGLGSFGSESDSSPVLQTSSSAISHQGEGSHSAEGGSGRQPGPSCQAKPMTHHGPQNNTDDEAKIFQVSYLGHCELDRRYTPQMLPWVMAQVRRENVHKDILIEVLPNQLLATTVATGEALFEHKLHTLSRFARSQQNHACFAYLTRLTGESPFTCHVFQAPEEHQVPELFGAIRNASKEASSGISQMAGQDASDHKKVSTSLFEILYVGKILVNTKKAPPTFIDEAVDKFKEYEEKRKCGELEEVRIRHSSGTSVQSLPTNLEKQVVVKEDELSRRSFTPLSSSESLPGSSETGSSHGSSDTVYSSPDSLPLGASSGSITLSASLRLMHLNQSDSAGKPTASSKPDSHLREQVPPTASSSSTSSGGHSSSAYSGAHGDAHHKFVPHAPSAARKNRTMLIQIGEGEVSLVSPDRKSIIFERKFKDISFCSQGIHNPEHFGFISRDPTSNNFVCYVFRCAAESVVEEVMQTLHTAFQQSAKNHVVCELCPMHQLNKLCQEIDKLPADKVNEILLRRVDQLNEKDHEEIMLTVKSAKPDNIKDMNEVVMIALHRMCEDKQREHIHLSDSTRGQNKYDFVLTENNKNVLSNLANRARKSLTTSFEQFIRITSRKDEVKESGRERRSSDSEGHFGRSIDSSEETPDTTPVTSPVFKEFHFNFPSPFRSEEESGRPRSSTLPEIPSLREHGAGDSVDGPAKSTIHHAGSPMKQMFIRVGNNNSVTKPSPLSLAESYREPESPTHKGSWRLTILNRVVTPAKVKTIQDHLDDNHPMPSHMTSPRKSRLTPQKIKALWRKAILETLLLIRMERENRTLQARQDEVEVKRLKLDYEEITPCLKEVTKVWESLLLTPGRPIVTVNNEILIEAVKDGVPRTRRGDIWAFCVEQHRLHHPGLQKPHSLLEERPYEDLLKQLTMHQHAILIDLGRTFPSHPFFSTQLGPGQLSLFNLLKAYSLLDKEVGYCQGLSFVAGILLIHMPEERAFETMKYLMFTLGFRRQYRPDMVALQIQMYQLSRLLHDNYRDLYDHLELYEIAPTLYAAPWFLTIFASQFPLGFVSRVFDLIFLQGMEVVFKVALVLLGNHKELIKQCDSFESVVEFLKSTLPSMGIIQKERIINQVFAMDLSKQLHAYEVEYHVLQEEMMANPPPGDTDAVARLETSNQNLKQQKMELLEQLQVSRSQNNTLESQITSLQSNSNKLKSHIRTLELERGALLDAVTKLRSLVPEEELEKANIEIPAISTDTTMHSPIHNPLANRFLEAGVIQLKTNSLTELDKEVAALMASKRAEARQSGNTLTVDSDFRERPASSVL